MADVLANLKSGNLEEVPDSAAALQAGTHGIPMHSPQGEQSIANSLDEASQLQAQGYTQPSTEQLAAGLDRAKVNTTGEKIGSTLEGGGEGAGTVYTGLPVTTAAEIGLGKLLNIKELSPEMVELRHKYNAGYEAAGNVAGAGLASYFGGEATLPFTLPKVAEAGLAKAFGSQLSRVGSIAARNMVQGALFSGSQELGKFMYDPSQTAEKAIANTSLNSAIAGAAGVAFGSVPTLWNKSRDAAFTTKYLKNLKDGINASPTGQSGVDQLADLGISGVAPDAVTAGTSDSPFLQNSSASLTNQRESATRAARIHTDNVNILKGKLNDSTLEALGTDPQSLAAIKYAGDNETATPIRQGLVQKAQGLYDAQHEAWEAVNPKLAGTVVPTEAGASFADRMSEVRGAYAKTPNTTPEFGLIDDAMRDLPNLETLQDYTGWASGIKKKLWGTGKAPLYPQAWHGIANAVDDWTDQYKLTALSAIDPQAVPMLTGAKQATRNMYNFMRSTSMALKLGEPGENPKEWIADLANPLLLEDKSILAKTLPADNDAFIDWAQKDAPEIADPIRNAYRQKIIQQASNNVEREYRPATAWKNIQAQWSPKTQDFVMADLPKFAKTMDVLSSIPSSYSPSGPMLVNAAKNWMGGLGAFIGHTMGGPAGAAAGWALTRLGTSLGGEAVDALKLSALKFAETGVIDAPAMKAMNDFFGHATTAQTVMDSAIANIFKAPGNDLPPQARSDQKGAADLRATVDKYQMNPETMLNIGGNLPTYIPDHSQALAGIAGRAQQYLQKLKPDTTPLGPLDSDKMPSRVDQAKYDRALNLVNKPLAIFENLKKGNLTQEDLAVMEGVYPGLYKDMKTKILNGLMEHKSQGKILPYQQRLALSSFLGINLDSTIGPMTMMTLMQNQQKQPAPGGQGQKKGPGAARSDKIKNIPGNDMTENQRAEQDRITPQ